MIKKIIGFGIVMFTGFKVVKELKPLLPKLSELRLKRKWYDYIIE